MEETISTVADWFSKAAGVDLPDNRLAARGRLALLLADIPGRYQAYIMAEPPLPPEVSAALKRVISGPNLSCRGAPWFPAQSR